MKFHDELNQKIFNGEELKSEVRDKLLEIADAFIDFLEVDKDAIKDIVITGSMASYNYTKYSDIDLHLKVDFDKIHEDCPIVQGYLWQSKAMFNKNHDIFIYGIPVEVYAESIDEDTVHNGLYSLKQDKWIDFPEKIEPTDNDSAVKAKFQEFKDMADNINDSEEAEEIIDKLYIMRKAGLEDGGEFSTENLAFKKVRDAGILGKLKEMKKAKIDKQLSLESYNEEVVTKTQNGVTWTGFDTENNDKIWVESEGSYTFVKYQPNETQIESVFIQEVNKDNYKEQQRYHTNIPIQALKHPMYTFWLGKDYWMDNLQDAIDFIYKHFEHERNKNESIKEDKQLSLESYNEEEKTFGDYFHSFNHAYTLDKWFLIHCFDGYKPKEYKSIEISHPESNNGIIIQNKGEQRTKDKGNFFYLLDLEGKAKNIDSPEITVTIYQEKVWIPNNITNEGIGGALKTFCKDWSNTNRYANGHTEYYIELFDLTLDKNCKESKAIEQFLKQFENLLQNIDDRVTWEKANSNTVDKNESIKEDISVSDYLKSLKDNGTLTDMEGAEYLVQSFNDGKLEVIAGYKDIEKAAKRFLDICGKYDKAVFKQLFDNGKDIKILDSDHKELNELPKYLSYVNESLVYDRADFNRLINEGDIEAIKKIIKYQKERFDFAYSNKDHEEVSKISGEVENMYSAIITSSLPEDEYEDLTNLMGELENYIIDKNTKAWDEEEQAQRERLAKMLKNEDINTLTAKVDQTELELEELIASLKKGINEENLEALKQKYIDGKISKEDMEKLVKLSSVELIRLEFDRLAKELGNDDPYEVKEMSEDINSLCDKIDSVNNEIKDWIKTFIPTPAMVECNEQKEFLLGKKQIKEDETFYDLNELRLKLSSFIEGNETLKDVDNWNEHDESGLDIYMNNTDMLDWSEDLYNEWVKFVNSYELEGDGYSISLSTDGSGYNYWIKNQEETPHLAMVIKTKGLNDDQYDKLLDDIIKVYQEYDNEETRLWQLAKDLKESLKETFKASDFDDLNIHDIHYHGTNKDGTLDFICYELQGKEFPRTTLVDDADVEAYVYTDTLDKKEVHLMIKPKIEMKPEDIETVALDAKEALDKLGLKESIEDVYAKNLADREDLDNIWILKEFTDNMDSEDGYSYEEYTKIGLIDTINMAAEPIEDEPLTREATNQEVIDCLEYLGTNAQLIRIKPYSERTRE